MIKKMQWQVVLTNDNKLVTLEEYHNFTMDNIQNHLIAIGILENLKQKHLDAINLLFSKSAKTNKENLDL